MRERTREKISILPIIEDKRPKHEYYLWERGQETKILILPIIEDKRPKH